MGITIIIIVVISLFALLVVLGGFIIVLYNRLVKQRNKVDEAWSDIDVQLKRRYDLIPNLVETVKGYASHESQTLTNVTEARSRAMGAQNPKEKAVAENMLTDTLKSLFSVVEQYPDLKANQNFASLQQELTDTEDKIEKSRRYYNGSARDMNNMIQVFPNNLLAGMLGFKKREYFQTEKEEERENVKVDF